MLPANRHLLPVIGIDIHIVIILGAPVPIPHPFIGLVFDPMDWIPKIGSTVNVNGIPRGNTGTTGMLGSKVHIPLGGPFAMPPIIGHDSKNFFGSKRVVAEGSFFSGAGFMLMSCNDIGLPLSITPGKKFKPVPTLYLPTSVAIPIPAGNPVIVAGPYVPDLMGMLMGLVMSFGFGALMKAGGALAKKALTKLNGLLKKKLGPTNSLSKFLCKHGFEPVNLITGSVLYEGVDFEIPGPIPIKWERNWYSDSSYQGMLGHGTHLSYDLSLQIFLKESGIGIFLPDGRLACFPLILAEQESFYNRSEKLTLTCKGRNNYELLNHDSRLTYFFERINGDIFKPARMANTSGLSIRFFYNKNHCLDKIIDTAGREILIRLDVFSRVIKVEAEHKGLHRTFVEYAYNEVGDLSAITDANGKTTSIRYQNHLMVEKTDRNGQTFYWKYDGFSTGARCVHTYGDGGILEGRIEYKNGFNIVTNSLGEKTIYYYDENQLCIQETDALGHSVFHQYNDFMEPYRDIDEEGNITGYVYDSRGNMTAMQKPDGSVINYLYNQSGLLEMAGDAEGNSTVFVYKNDLLKSVIDVDRAVTNYNYNQIGLIETISNAKGDKTLLHYDTDNNLDRLILPDGAEAGWRYDAWARCIVTTNPENQSQYFNYDLLDRVTGIKKYDGNKVQLQYNAYEEVVLAEDTHHKVKFEYTPMGSLKSREEKGSSVKFVYNTEERLVALTNENNEAYRFGYDPTGKLVQETGFDGIRRQYLRDRAGKVIKVSRPGGKFTEYEYDLSGRLTRAEYSDGTWEVYSYNRTGQLIEAANQNSHVFITRDASGRIISENQDGHTVDSEYDELGKRVKISSSLGALINIERNEAGLVGRMTASNNEGTNWEAEFKYNALGQETERILPGGITSTFQYDRAGHPVDHKVKSGDRTVSHRIYTWNVNDRLQSMMNGLTKGVVQYGHDDFGNLAWAKYEDGQYDYRMPDKVGNLYKTKERKDRKYGAGGRLLESNGTKYEYDEEGNLMGKNLPDGTRWHYFWSGNGMLNKVIRPDLKEVGFEYDALKRRSAKIFQNNITRWIWNGNVPIHEWKYESNYKFGGTIDSLGQMNMKRSETLTALTTWIFDDDGFIPCAKLSNFSLSIATDYLGTPLEMFDSTGESVWKSKFNTRKKISERTSNDSYYCPLRFQGQYEDIEIDLYYNRFRYYSQSEEIFLSQDPMRLAGNKNLYAYVTDPNKLVDALGLAECLKTFNSLNEAREAAKKSAGLGDDAVDFIQELGPHKGRITGRMSPDGSKGWRIDFDEKKGFHVNWWDRSGGPKRSSWQYGANTVKGGTQDTFLSLLEHFPQY